MLDDQREAQIDLFEGAKANRLEPCNRALARGADLNYVRYKGRRLMGWEGWQLRLGRAEWGTQEWEAPPGVHPENGDTLLMIAFKANQEELVTWILSHDNIDTGARNAAQRTALDVAYELGREDWLKPSAQNGPTQDPSRLVNALAECALNERTSACDNDDVVNDLSGYRNLVKENACLKGLIQKQQEIMSLKAEILRLHNEGDLAAAVASPSSPKWMRNGG